MLYKITLHDKHKTSESAGILRSLLVNMGFSLYDIVENSTSDKMTLSLYVKNAPALKKMKRRLQTLSMTKVRMRVRELKNDEWQNAWKEDIKFFYFTDRFKVVPLWHKSQVHLNNREPLYIDTDLAFGTGLLETTKFLAEMIVKKEGQFFSFLDIGAGTEIFSIAAHKCHAQRICALDINAHAVKKAQKNMRLNHGVFTSLDQIDFRSYKKRKKFDFIAENINTYDLILIHDKMCKLLKTGGFLAVSGMVLRNFSKMKHTLFHHFLYAVCAYEEVKGGQPFCIKRFKREDTV